MATRNVHDIDRQDLPGIILVMVLTMGIAAGLPLIVQAL